MGGNDSAYNRNKIAAERTAELDRLEKADPAGYVHMSRIYEGLGHWMNKKDAEALPWMAGFERNPWPNKVVWQQDDVVHRRFYWLEIPLDTVITDRAKIAATVTGQAITLEGDVPASVHVRLSDRLLDLDQPLTVTVNGREAFSGKVLRNAVAMVVSLAERVDMSSAATATVTINVERMTNSSVTEPADNTAL